MKFTCNHEAAIPANMGRGRARQERIANYFDRPCRTCRVAQIATQVAQYKRLDGTPIERVDADRLIADRAKNLRY